MAYLFSLSSEDLPEPSFYELRIVDAISRNSPSHVLRAVNTLVTALCDQPLDDILFEQLRLQLYLFLSDLKRGIDRSLVILLPQGRGYLKLEVKVITTSPTVTFTAMPRILGFLDALFGSPLITGLPIPLISIADPRYSGIAADSTNRSTVKDRPVDALLPNGEVPDGRFADAEWERWQTQGPTTLDRFAALAIHSGSAQGLLALLNTLASELSIQVPQSRDLTPDLEYITALLCPLRYALSSGDHEYTRLRIPGTGGYLHLSAIKGKPHICLSVGALPYPNRVGYDWDELLSERPILLPSSSTGTLAPVPAETHRRARLLSKATGVAFEYALQLLIIGEIEGAVHQAIDLVTSRSPEPSLDEPATIQSLFRALAYIKLNPRLHPNTAGATPEMAHRQRFPARVISFLTNVLP